MRAERNKRGSTLTSTSTHSHHYVKLTYEMNVIAVIRHIPPSFRVRDLRRFFYAAIEGELWRNHAGDGLIAFHFLRYVNIVSLRSLFSVHAPPSTPTSDMLVMIWSCLFSYCCDVELVRKARRSAIVLSYALPVTQTT